MFVVGLASADILLFPGILIPSHGRGEPCPVSVDFADALHFHHLHDIDVN